MFFYTTLLIWLSWQYLQLLSPQGSTVVTFTLFVTVWSLQTGGIRKQQQISTSVDDSTGGWRGIMAWWALFPGRTIHWLSQCKDFVPMNTSFTFPIPAGKQSKSFSSYFPFLLWMLCVSVLQQIRWLVDYKLEKEGEQIWGHRFWIEIMLVFCFSLELGRLLSCWYSLSDNMHGYWDKR